MVVVVVVVVVVVGGGSSSSSSNSNNNNNSNHNNKKRALDFEKSETKGSLSPGTPQPWGPAICMHRGLSFKCLGLVASHFV